MASAHEVKLEPGTSVVPNVKCEPKDESMQLKITNVFSFTTDNVVESPKDSNSIWRSSNKLLKNRSVTETSNDLIPEDIASGGRYGLRKRSVKSYDENMVKPDSSSPVRVRKQNLKPAKKQTNESLKKHTPPCKETKSPEKNQDNLTCDICSTVFFSVESLEEHVVDVHVVDKEFKCKECAKSFISQDRLKSHIAKHEEEPLYCDKCPICSKTFASRCYLSKHLVTHKADRPFKCKLCPNSYVLKLTLLEHEMNHHGKEKIYKCSKCPKSFARKYTLEDHLRTHSNAKNIVCENCSATFKTKTSVRNHRAYCKGLSSQNKLSGKVAARRKFGEVKSKRRIAAEYKHIKRNREYKQHRCNVCDKVCMSLGNLRIHLITHSDERNFKCHLCPMTYKRKQHLNGHLKEKHGKSD